MGLCKCRNVTNLFCYNHRKNVCTNCLSVDKIHEHCIVGTYIQWLQNSEFSPNCTICSELLEQQQVIRLSCLDLFHAACIKAYYAEHNGCPKCGRPIFPDATNTSPFAENVRKVLGNLAIGKPTPGRPVPSDGSLAIEIDLSPAPQTVASPQSPLSAPFTSSSQSGRQLSRKMSSNRDLRDGDADKYGRQSAQGLVSAVTRLCQGRWSARRLLLFLTTGVVLFTLTTTLMLRYQE